MLLRLWHGRSSPGYAPEGSERGLRLTAYQPVEQGHRRVVKIHEELSLLPDLVQVALEVVNTSCQTWVTKQNEVPSARV
jgi:hypothetical protein